MNVKSLAHFLSYVGIRTLLFPFSCLSYKTLHRIGPVLSTLAFPFLKKYRKRALSNLSIASSLNYSNSEIERLAKESLSSLFITALEYGKLAKEKNIHTLVHCINPEEADDILARGKGIIFFCAHQSNWELLYLEGMNRMKGIAIGQPVANQYLYRWILRIREKFGGKIVQPHQSVKEGLKALKKHIFLGIVGDQALPSGGYSSSFLGREAYSSPLPALLSHRSGCPIIFATTIRKEGEYIIRYSPAIWPNLNLSMEEDVPLLMDQALSYLQSSIKHYPGQWLWQHNKWKQQSPGRIKKAYRHDTIAIFLPLDVEVAKQLMDEIRVLKDIYPSEFIGVFAPRGCSIDPNFSSETTYYSDLSHLKRKDYRFKLVFNFTSDRSLSKHFLRLAAFEVLTLSTLARLSKAPLASLNLQLKKVILNAS